MELNEIKKLLYKTKPDAELINIRSGIAYYQTHMSIKKDDGHEYNETIRHEVPISDMGTADFYPVMPARLLIRWIKL